MTVKITLPDSQGKVYLLCPFCSANTLKSAKLLPTHKPIRIDCPCGNSYEFIIEYRKAFRKKTSLPCIYWKTATLDVFQNGTISDLTLEGCCLLVSDKHTLNEGDYIKLHFELDNSERTKIKREAVICRISENYIGCQFVDKAALDSELGFYVQDFKVPK